jgi:hypothetical protein
VNGVWYLLTRVEYAASDFSQLGEFLKSASGILNTRKLAVTITVLGVTDLISKRGEALLSFLNDSGIWTSIQTVPCAEFTFTSISPSIDALMNQIADKYHLSLPFLYTSRLVPMDQISHVATTGVVSDWVKLRTELLCKLSISEDGPSISPADLSPASTIQLGSCQPDIHFIREWILSLEAPPLCVQRLCEVVKEVSPDKISEVKFFSQLERILSSSRPIRWNDRELVVRRRSTSIGGSSSFTPSPNRRILKRSRIVF